MKKNKKVVRYRKPIKINIGIIIFGIILIYIIFNIFSYVTRKHISVYEVQQGTIATNHTYRGLILRNEEIITSDGDGYLTYFLKDGSKAGAKTPVYSIDSSGNISSQIASAKKEDNLLTEENYQELEDSVHSFTSTFNSQNFYSIYSFKDEMAAQLMEIQNVNALEQIGSDAASGNFSVYYAQTPGVVVYYIDGYENASVDSLTPEMFDENQYQKTNLKEQEQIQGGAPVYKVITDENWNIVFQISDSLAEKLKDDNTVEIMFKDDGNKVWAYYNILKIGKDSYLNLQLRTSVLRFANQRFIDIELLIDDAQGLKIPNTAIAKKSFFTVPKEYFVKGGDSSSKGLVISSKGKKGVDSDFVTPTIFYEKDGMYYIDDELVDAGTVIKKPDSNETYTIKETKDLKGVYNINKGYAVFKQIDILYQNEEYSILKKGTDYGISLYDHIALEGDSIEENDLVH